MLVFVIMADTSQTYIGKGKSLIKDKVLSGAEKDRLL